MSVAKGLKRLIGPGRLSHSSITGNKNYPSSRVIQKLMTEHRMLGPKENFPDT